MRRRDDLRPDQRELIDALKAGSRLAVMTMGGGKTAAALTAFADLQAAGEVRGGIVIAPPLIAATVWPAEPAKWSHLRHLRVEHIAGSPATRLRRLRETDADLIVLSNALIPWLDKRWADVPDRLRGVMILDETSAYKSPTAKRGKVLRQIAPQMDRVWGATGTPRPRSMMDLWGQLTIISQGCLWPESFYRWRATHYYTRPWRPYEWLPFPGAEDQISAEADPWVVAPVAADRGVRGLIAGEDHDLEAPMPTEAAALYRELEREVALALGDDLASGTVTPANAAVRAGKLRQIVGGVLHDDDGGVLMVDSWKYDRIAEILEDTGENIVVTYDYVAQIDRLKDALRRAGGTPAQFGRLGGVSPSQARRVIERWNAGEIRLLALSPAAAGHGVELQHGGRRIIWLSPPWSSEAYQQTIARLRRPGQTQTVYSHRLIAGLPDGEPTVDHVARGRSEGRAEAEAEWIRRIIEKWTSV